MKKQTRMRLGLMLVLALVVGFTGFADHKAEAACSSYGNCEICLNREEACQNGLTNPDCGGDYDCCHAKVASCYRCCIWY
jgi:hypothetical protein